MFPRWQVQVEIHDCGRWLCRERDAGGRPAMLKHRSGSALPGAGGNPEAPRGGERGGHQGAGGEKTSHTPVLRDSMSPPRGHPSCHQSAGVDACTSRRNEILLLSPLSPVPRRRAPPPPPPPGPAVLPTPRTVSSAGTTAAPTATFLDSTGAVAAGLGPGSASAGGWCVHLQRGLGSSRGPGCLAFTTCLHCRLPCALPRKK